MNLRELADTYLAGATTLRNAVGEMAREQSLARPVPGKWSTLEVACHLADFEPVYVDRMKRVIALDEPALLAADEKLFAARLTYHERDLAEELAVVEITRKQMTRILKALPEVAGLRIGIHNERGPRTLTQLVETAIGHIDHHAPFIVEKRLALGLKV